MRSFTTLARLEKVSKKLEITAGTLSDLAQLASGLSMAARAARNLLALRNASK